VPDAEFTLCARFESTPSIGVTPGFLCASARGISDFDSHEGTGYTKGTMKDKKVRLCVLGELCALVRNLR
jgi:hypothetical protein